MAHEREDSGIAARFVDDAELLRRLLRRDEQAWYEFRRRFDRLLRHVIQRMIRRFPAQLSRGDEEEIHALFLYRLSAHDMRRLRTFEPTRGIRLSTWLSLLATNTAWDYLRALSRRPRSRALELERIAPGPCEGDPFAALSEKQYWLQARKVVDALSVKDRTLMTLLMHEKTPEEIAERMCISVKTVYTKKHKLRSRLREQLAVF